MKIRTIIPASDLLELQPSKKIVKSSFAWLLRISEKYFGSSVLLEMPSELQEVKLELLPVIEMASRIKSLGLIQEIKKKSKATDEPSIFRYSATPAIDGSGSDFLSEEGAIWKTLGESVERSLWRNSGDFYEKKVISASYSEISDQALDIFSLAGFSDEQQLEHSLLAFDKNTRFGWLKANSLTSNGKILCPVQLLSANYWNKNVKNPKCESKPEPMLRWSVTTGLATGQSLEEALVKGILEIIERDAFMISYLNELSPPLVDLEDLAEQDNDLQKILSSFQRYELEVNLIQLVTDFPVHVYLSVIIDHTGLGPAVAVGASADFNLKACLVDALSESLSVRLSLKKYFNKKTASPEKLDRHGRLVYWTKMENFPKINFFLRGPKTRVDLAKNKSFFQINLFKQKSFRKAYYKKKLAILKNELRRKKYEALYSELPDSEIKKLGFRCIQAVIPNLQPMHLYESIPYFSGNRLKEIPEKFGYSPLGQVNQTPHPFP